MENKFHFRTISVLRYTTTCERTAKVWNVLRYLGERHTRCTVEPRHASHLPSPELSGNTYSTHLRRTPVHTLCSSNRQVVLPSCTVQHAPKLIVTNYTIDRKNTHRAFIYPLNKKPEWSGLSACTFPSRSTRLTNEYYLLNHCTQCFCLHSVVLFNTIKRNGNFLITHTVGDSWVTQESIEAAVSVSSRM